MLAVLHKQESWLVPEKDVPHWCSFRYWYVPVKVMCHKGVPHMTRPYTDNNKHNCLWTQTHLKVMLRYRPTVIDYCHNEVLSLSAFVGWSDQFAGHCVDDNKSRRSNWWHNLMAHHFSIGVTKHREAWHDTFDLFPPHTCSDDTSYLSLARAFSLPKHNDIRC